MPQNDYSRTPNERAWLVLEPTFNTLVEPAVTDELIVLPGVSLPPVLREFTPSAERNPSAGVRNLIKRKKRPGAFSIPVYTKFADAPGTPPQYGVALRRGMGVETINAGVSVVYQLATAIEETSFSIWHLKDNEMSGFRGCLANLIRVELSGSEEGRITFEGFTGNEVFAGTTTLNAAMDAVQTTMDLGTTGIRRFQVGPAASDVIFVKVDTEVLKITAINYATGIATVVRAQKGSVAAAHSIGAEVFPWNPGADTDPNDVIATIVEGTIDLGAILALRIISFTVEINNNLEPRIDEWGLDTLTGYRRTDKRQVTGAVRAYARQEWQSFKTNLEREQVEDAVIKVGSVGAGKALMTIDIDRMRFNNVTLDGGGPEFAFEFAYQALESSTGNDEIKLTMT